MNEPSLSGRTTETMDAPQLVNFTEKSPFLISYIPTSSCFAPEPLAKQRKSVMRQTETEILAMKICDLKPLLGSFLNAKWGL